MKPLFTYALPLLGALAIPQLTIAQSVIDQKPTYRQHDPAFIVDRIEYQKEATVVHFRYAPEYMSASASFFPPKHPTAWILRDDKGQIYPLKALKNLSNGRDLISKEVTKTEYVANPKEVIAQDWSGNDFVLFKAAKLNATCELYFDKLAAGVKKIDLVEGIGKDQEYHFNAFDIEVKNTPEIVAAAEVLTIKPATEEIIPQRQVKRIQINKLRTMPEPFGEVEEMQTVELTTIEVVAKPALLEQAKEKPNTQIKRIGCGFSGHQKRAEAKVAIQRAELAVKEIASVAEIKKISNYSIFPNPNRGFFNLQNKSEAQKDAVVQILDMSGRLLLSQQVQIDAAASQKIEIQDLSAGQYLVRVQTAQEAAETLPMIVIE